MADFYTLASTRRSIRKFTDTPVPDGVIEDCIRTAVTAPSGCNSQCWKFAVVRDREILEKIAEAVRKKTAEILSADNGPDREDYIAGKQKLVTFFLNAPVSIAVFMTELEYYDPRMTGALRQKGITGESWRRLFAYPDVLSVGAAIQNLLLALHEKGFGACWMNDPAIAGDEINRILDIPEEYPFISLIPVGYPAYTPRFKEMKPMEEILLFYGKKN